MGSPTVQNNQPSQVYYDPEKGQYFSYKQDTSNPLASVFAPLGIRVNGQESNLERMYYGNSLTSSADRFTPKYVPATYPEMNMLFPALNAGLSENILTSLLPSDNTQSSGAGRFLAPSNTSKGK